MKRSRVRALFGWCPKETTLKPRAPPLMNSTRLLALMTLVTVAASGIFSIQYLSPPAPGVVPTLGSLGVTSPSLIQCRNGSFLLAYTARTSENEYQILVSSSGEGLHWTRPASVTGSSFKSNNLVPSCSMIQRVDGIYMIAYTWFDRTTRFTYGTYAEQINGGVNVTTSTDGHEWNTPTRVDSTVGGVSLVQNRDGSYTMGLFDFSYNDKIYVAASLDGLYWERRALVASGEYPSQCLSNPCLIVTRDGSCVMAHMRGSWSASSYGVASAKRYEKICFLECADGSNWRAIGNTTVPEGGSGDVSLIEGRDGALMVAFVSEGSGTSGILGEVLKEDGTWSGPVGIAEGSDPSLAQLSDGSYMIAISGGADIYLARSGDGYSWGAPVAVSRADSGVAPVESTVYVAAGVLWCLSGACAGLLIMKRRRGSDR